MAKSSAVSEFRAGLRAGEGRKRRGHHRRGQFTLPIAVIAGFAPVATDFWKYTTTQGIGAAMKHTTAIMTGYSEDNKWHPENLKYGLVPILMGFGAHWLIGGKLGVNRMLSRAKIPFIRI